MRENETIYKIVASVHLDVMFREDGVVLKSGQLPNTQINGAYLHTMGFELEPATIKPGETGFARVKLVANKSVKLKKGTPIEFHAGTQVIAKGIVTAIHEYKEINL